MGLFHPTQLQELIKDMRKVLIILLFLLNTENLYAIESKIVYKINNEIITNIDIKNEFNYLLALNDELKNLEDEKIFNIAAKSIIREKIKKIELLKNFKSLEVDKEFMELIIKNIYSNLDIETLKDFESYLEIYKVNFDKVKEKAQINALWNQLIIKKYSSLINIDIKKIRRELEDNKIAVTKSYLLSEIVYEVKNKNEIYKKYEDIKKSIKEIGFDNTVLTYSISDSSKNIGKIGWINERALNKTIKNKIYSLDLNQISEPIKINSGVLILRINDVKEEKKVIDTELELKKIVNYQNNKQLEQYSKIYFNKIRNNLEINE